MKISGHEIAEEIYKDLRERVGELKKKNVTPKLVVILVGNNPGSIAYVNQKELSGAKIGAVVEIKRFDETITTEELESVLTTLNQDPTVHGILLQRPLPKQIDVDHLVNHTNPQKDIDGFNMNSPYVLPLPLAIVKILTYVFRKTQNTISFMQWISAQNVVILGKGETGGQPIIAYLKSLEIKPQVIDSKTPHPEEITKKAEIIISAVGKQNTIKPENIKEGVILLGVGMSQGENKKLVGDYKAKDIDSKALFYTPTPGGVGPVNVAMLLDNLVTAAERQSS